MKIEKVALCLHRSAKFVASKLGLPSPSFHAVELLYTISIIHPCTLADIGNYQKQVIGSFSPNSIQKSLAYLVKARLIDRSEYTYTLSPLGREYLTRIRKYLLNVRL
jgi:DNA-binding PadR family transcriptional regulator